MTTKGHGANSADLDPTPPYTASDQPLEYVHNMDWYFSLV